ncbi:GyrI-like domain-containing protein [Chitinophaga varians]|nr:GyrI-like domain-containing protein [Chitinophaga varians]
MKYRDALWWALLLLIGFKIDATLNLTQMDKLDLTKAFKSYYTATTAPQLAVIEKGLFLTINGKGDPNGDVYAENLGALYAVAYGIKFLCKKADKDFTVSKLEGFWWVEDTSVEPLQVPRSEWYYELAIRMPDYVTRQQLSASVLSAEKKKQSQLFRNVDLKTKEEGKCVQLMHIGPFSEEPASLQKMEGFMHQHGLQMNGRHHEIYLSDYRKTAPEKLKTILRHPVK